MLESCVHNSQPDSGDNLEEEIKNDAETILKSHALFHKYIKTDLPKDGISLLANLRKKASLIIRGELTEERIVKRLKVIGVKCICP